MLPALVLPVAVLAFSGAATAQVVINEILPNPGSEFDGAEYIELYNPTGAAVSLAGWVLTGTEFDGTCGGEDDWQFPAGASIPAGGRIIVAKDNIDAPGEEQDGFFQRFGFNADFELYDPDQFFEFDDPAVPNLTVLVNSSFDDQIGLVPGNGYAASCNGTFNRYEALYLYDGVPGGGGTVVDVIEYRDPVDCTGDTCLGVGTGDDDALVAFPGVGEVICRDASGTDTDNSAADLALGTNTPGGPNIQNPGPALSNLAIDNPGPDVGETVSVTINATDPDGIGSMWVVYTVNGGSPDSAAMSLSGVDQYTGTIPSQIDDANVTYFVRGYDGGNAAGVGSSKFPDFGRRALRWGTQTIFSVQNFSPPSDTGFSDEVGNAVNIEGIVTAQEGLYNAGMFVIESPAGGYWNGVHCFDNTSSTVVQRGDLVRVSGVVTEYFNLTEVDFFGSENVEILSSGNPLPGPTIATASQLTDGSAFGELLEGVYTRIENVEVTLADDGFGQWLVTDGTGSALIGDDAFYLYQPTLGDSIDAVEGVTGYSFSERKLEPRDTSDIIGPPIVSTVRYSPIPPTAAGPITISAIITDNGTINRAKLYFSTDNGASFDSTDLGDQGGNLWAASVGPFTDGTIVDYRVEVTDDSGFDARQPAIGEYDLYVGLVEIATVQGTFAAGSDASAFEGQPRNVSGIVTVAPGTLADNIYVIQNTWDTTPAYHGIHVFSGGNLTGQIEIGDSVSVSGDVDEFFGLTQIEQHFTDSWTSHGVAGELPGFDIQTTQLPPDSTGAVPAGEAWEGVLVQASGSVITNAAAGFGQYFVDNTDPRSGEETLVDDEARFGGLLTFEPALGDSVTVRGVGDFSFGEYKIQPRNDSDILPYDPADAVGVGVGPAGEIGFALHQSSPNPFSGGTTRIGFALPRETRATLRVFDVRGRLVRTLVDGALPAGRHDVTWDGRNTQDRPVASGVYFYRLRTGEEEATRKLLLLR
jgi:hypothetical protein